MAKQSGDKQQKSKSLEYAIREIQGKYGEGSIMKLGETKKVDVDAIPTGSLALDAALGVGGIPRGRVIELYGPESSGKTTLALHIVAEAQKKGGIAAFIDAEHALDPEYARRIGVKINDLFLSQPDTGEQGLEIVESLVKSGAVDLIVVDSVAALTPRAEIEGEMGQQHMGLQARLMSHALRKLTGIVAKGNCTIIFINQIRMQLGIVFGNPETTPGGKALKFYASVRIEVRKAAPIKKGDQVIGNRVKAKIVKNKVAPPFRTAEFDIFYNEGIAHEFELINLGIKFGVVRKSGASFSYENVKLGQGFDAARLFLKENGKVRTELEKELKAKAESGALPVVAGADNE
ncbi:MAG: recombinase RecA [Candidatus Sungbacteria bacterium]|nr:recombinase RecA [Candidatus Sungbacteria bacterium]